MHCLFKIELNDCCTACLACPVRSNRCHRQPFILLSPCHIWPDWTSERETDKNFCYPVMFVNIRFMSVLCSEHSFHVRWCAVCPSASVEKFCACSKIETDGNEQEYPFVVLCMSVLSCISPVIVRNSLDCGGHFCYPVMFVNIRFMSVLCSEHSFHVLYLYFLCFFYFIFIICRGL